MHHKLRLHSSLATTLRQEIRELYASVAFADMAAALAVVFEPIILYTVLGLDIIQILLFMSALYAIQAVLLPLGARIASKLGYMHTIFLSIPFMAIYWMLIYGAQFDFKLIYFVPVIYGIERALFWPAFHSVAARYVNARPKKEKNGAGQRDGLYAMIVVMRILGPLLGGIVGSYLGLGVVLLLAAAMYLTSLLPLLVSKEIYTPSQYKFDDTWQIYKKFPRRFISYLGSGEEVIIFTLWPILIYLYTQSFILTGLVVSASAVITAIALYSIKHAAGLHDQLLLRKVGAFFYTLVNLARLAVSTFYGLIVVDALGRSTKELVSIPVTTLTYERAEKNGILAYVVFYQQSAALGKCLAAILAVIVFGFTGSLLAVFILAGFFTMLYMLE